MTGPFGGTKNPLMNQFIGKAVSAAVTHVLGWETTDLYAKYRGLDALQWDPAAERFAVVEAKDGSSRLKPGQLEWAWIKSKYNRLLEKHGAAPSEWWGRADSARKGKKWAFVVSTDFSRKSAELVAQIQTWSTHPGSIKAWDSRLR